MFKFRLGDQVRDRVTGFEGVVTSRTDYLNGCVRYGVSPRKLKDDGSFIEAVWIDEPQLTFIDSTDLTVIDRADEPAERRAAYAGGPQPNPQRPADPKSR